MYAKTHVSGTVCKLVYTRQILIRFYTVEETVGKSSTHDATMKFEITLSLIHDVRIQTRKTLCNMLQGQDFSPQQKLFEKTAMPHEEICLHTMRAHFMSAATCSVSGRIDCEKNRVQFIHCGLGKLN